ncbi:complement C1q subcomponent subunit B-like [Mytilus trossulus]|uniref:complement C1q subcomponent subunit B-like n=1 Tax=Mytilus trossulus TaxID=6551 RepID=UPI003006D898
MKNMKGKLESIKEHNNAFRTEMEDKFYTYRKEINEAKKVIYTHRPGFYATLSSAISLGQTQRIEFDKIITDVTKSYNNITGVFTLPKDGLYHFSVTILSSSGAVHVEIMQNHQVIGQNYGSTSYVSATSNIVNSCKQGDFVFVRHMEGH